MTAYIILGSSFHSELFCVVSMGICFVARARLRVGPAGHLGRVLIHYWNNRNMVLVNSGFHMLKNFT